MLQQMVVEETVSFRHVHGPIPPASELADLDRVVPGAAERIIASYENQIAHRQGLENRKVNSDIASEKRGSWQGWSIAICGLVVAGVMGYTGHDRTAQLIATVDLGSLVTVFVIGRAAVLHELRRKRRDEASSEPEQEQESK
jgi:uncharacterized membrane protein